MRILESDRISTDTTSSMAHGTAKAALAFSLRPKLVRCDLDHRPEQPTKPWDSPNVIDVIIVPPSRIKTINRIGCLNAGSVVPTSIFYAKAVKCMADPPESGRNMVRGSSYGCFSTGHGSRATGIAFCPTAGIEAAQTLRSARATVSMSCVLNGLVAFRARAIFPAVRDAAAG
jgi:hypothetical protein